MHVLKNSPLLLAVAMLLSGSQVGAQPEMGVTKSATIGQEGRIARYKNALMARFLSSKKAIAAAWQQKPVQIAAGLGAVTIMVATYLTIQARRNGPGLRIHSGAHQIEGATDLEMTNYETEGKLALHMNDLSGQARTYMTTLLRDRDRVLVYTDEIDPATGKRIYYLKSSRTVLGYKNSILAKQGPCPLATELTDIMEQLSKVPRKPAADGVGKVQIKFGTKVDNFGPR